MKYLILAVAFLFAVPVSAASVSASASATACTMQYEPVCGIKRAMCISPSMTYPKQEVPCDSYKTYGNTCMLGADGATYVHAGECSAAELGQNGDEKPAEPPKAEPPQAYTPPKGCTAWYDGCNSCSTGTDGNSMCTLRACFAYQPGYCTKWDETPIPVEPNGGIGISPNDDGTTVGVEADANAEVKYEDASFFTRIWLNFLSWF